MSGEKYVGWLVFWVVVVVVLGAGYCAGPGVVRVLKHSYREWGEVLGPDCEELERREQIRESYRKLDQYLLEGWL